MYPVHVCPEGPPERPPPPSPVELLGAGRTFWEGGVMSVLCRVCHVFPPIVSIFGLFLSKPRVVMVLVTVTSSMQFLM